MRDCLYCQIVEGLEPAGIVYEDADVLAITAPEPLHPGHCLVMTKEHVGALHSLEPRVATHLWLVALTIERAMAKAGLRDEGINILVAEGDAAGQASDHLQLHLVPRETDDAWSSIELRRGQADRRMLERVACELRENLA